MKTQMLTQPAFVDAQNRTTLCCPQCKKSKNVDVTRLQGAATPPKVRCSCGHKFRVPLATQSAQLERCQTCAGRGYRLVELEKTVQVSTETGYIYTPNYRKTKCLTCQGTGLILLPAPNSIASTGERPLITTKRSGLRMLPQRVLKFLVVWTLKGLDWLAIQLSTHWPTLRNALEMNLNELKSTQK